MNSPASEEALSRCRIKLRQFSPYFAVLTLFASYRFDSLADIAETDGRIIRLNEDYFLGLQDDERAGLLLHVTLHAALQHPSRMHSRDPRLWNIACDIMVNHILRFQTPFPPPRGTLEAHHLDANLKPETAERVYEWLQKKRLSSEGALSNLDSVEGRQQKGNSKEGKNAARTQDNPQQDTANLRQSLRASSLNSVFAKRFSSSAVTGSETTAADNSTPTNPERGGIKPLFDLTPPSDPATKQILQQHWDAALKMAEQHNDERHQGIDPGQWIRELKAACEPTLDWRALLSRFVVQTPTDFSGLDRRFVHRGIYIETLEQETIKIAVCIDTSGSIRDDELDMITSELIAILGVYPSIECSLYFCDAGLHGPFELGRQQKIPPAVGGGGTDFTPFFEYLESHSNGYPAAHFCAAIYFTDGFGTFPSKAPEYPVLWVALPGAEQDDAFPFGEVIRIYR